MRTRAQRRHENQNRENRARRIVRLWRLWSGDNTREFEDWLVPRIADNLKTCNKECCCNPRRSGHGSKADRLTLQERRALLEPVM